MELRRILFEYRITRTRVAAEARALGYRLHYSQVSKIACDRHYAHPLEREAIRAGLKQCGVPDDVIEACVILRPRQRFFRDV